jgi:hypothetical protein
MDHASTDRLGDWQAGHAPPLPTDLLAEMRSGRHMVVSLKGRTKEVTPGMAQSAVAALDAAFGDFCARRPEALLFVAWDGDNVSRDSFTAPILELITRPAPSISRDRIVFVYAMTIRAPYFPDPPHIRIDGEKHPVADLVQRAGLAGRVFSCLWFGNVRTTDPVARELGREIDGAARAIADPDEPWMRAYGAFIRRTIVDPFSPYRETASGRLQRSAWTESDSVPRDLAEASRDPSMDLMHYRGVSAGLFGYLVLGLGFARLVHSRAHVVYFLGMGHTGLAEDLYLKEMVGIHSVVFAGPSYNKPRPDGGIDRASPNYQLQTWREKYAPPHLEEWGMSADEAEAIYRSLDSTSPDEDSSDDRVPRQ